MAISGMYAPQRNNYVNAFGEIQNNEMAQEKIIDRLLGYSDQQPDVLVNHNSWNEVPSSRLERWKWIVGVENRLDNEVLGVYNSQISLLENTQPTSIIQLKNLLVGFWHTDRQIKDYVQFKSDKVALATSGLINKIFFACIGFILKCFNNPVLKIGKNLEERSRETFAKIGDFHLNNKAYDVVAFHILADENSPSARCNIDPEHDTFFSESGGKTCVGIFEKQQPHIFRSLGHMDPNPSFEVLIGREGEEKAGISAEDCCFDHGKELVSYHKRHLLIRNSLEYRGSTGDNQGSDRLLDQKLTQIMVEMTMQNKGITTLRVHPRGSDLQVLAAGGFKTDSAKQVSIIDELKQFRSLEGNKLFPPNRDYGDDYSTCFNAADYTVENVFYSRGDPESWSTIIQRESILKPEAATLPEYWVIKPNLVEDLLC